MFDIAVITPTHNRATLLPAALDSILAQTTSARIEVAVVDDGSTDNTSEVMKPYLAKFSDITSKVAIRYTRQEKQGVVAARNLAIASTTAPLIAFLDSDDYWDRRKLEKQAAAMSRDPKIGVSHTSFRYVNEQGQFTDTGPQRLDNPCVGKCLNVLMNEFLVLFSSVMIRRTVVDEIARTEPHGLPFDPRWTNSQDYDLILRAARISELTYIPEPLTLYRLHGAHGAMGNLKRAYGFHSRVQIDFAKRWGPRISDFQLDEAEAKRRAGIFLYGRADSAFWRREFSIVHDLCDLARELDCSNPRFDEVASKASRPVWMYRLKDGMDRVMRRK